MLFEYHRMLSFALTVFFSLWCQQISIPMSIEFDEMAKQRENQSDETQSMYH